MKKLLFMLLFANACFAQGFIEVEVRDTIVMKPIGFVYEVSIADRYDYAEEVVVDTVAFETAGSKYLNDRKNAEVKKLRELEDFLKKGKYVYEQSKNYDNANIFIHGRKQKSFLVKLKSQSELDKLTGEIEKREDWSGTLSDIDYGNPDRHDAQLMDKLVKRAKTKAAMIAGLTQQKIGAIIEFREMKQSDNLNMTVVDLIMNSRRQNTRDFFKQGLNGELSKTVIVRFKTE